MSNHYHMVVRTPLSNLDVVLRHFQTEAARKIQKYAGRINHIFGGRYKWSYLPNAAAVACAYKYVLRNPVRAGLSTTVENYRFSTITPKLELPSVCGTSSDWSLVPKDETKVSKWLNQPTSKEADMLIGQALRRAHFKFSDGNDLVRSVRRLEQEYGFGTPCSFPAEK